MPPIPYLGSAYLGPAHEPFAVHGDPNDPHFEVPNIGLKDTDQRDRLGGRMRLRDRLDQLSRRADQVGKRDGFDAFQGQAWNVLTGPQARRAFDLSLEPDRVRDRYGRNSWGQRCLLGRRLVEAGRRSGQRHAATARCADGCRTGTTTPSITTSSTP